MSNFIDFQNYVNKLVSLGVATAARRTNAYHTSDYPGGMILSHDPATSHIPPKFIKMDNVDALKELCGIQDSMFIDTGLEDTHVIPPPVSELKYPITNPKDPHVCNALNAYIFGNSQSVSSWKDTLNKLRFPMQVAVFTAESITVYPGSPLILQGTDQKPIGGLFTTLTIEGNAQVITEGPGTVVVDQLVSSAAATAAEVGDGATITLVSIGGNGGNGGAGGNGAGGGTGTPGANATESGKSGCNAAGKGGKGGNGVDATAGGAGGNGGDANTINYSVTTMNGSFIVGSVGGNGGNGGQGGNGGNGGNGGPGGAACRDCGTGPQGDAGNGGAAGNGGPAGNGGNGQKVYINYQNGSPTITPTTQQANGGNGANPGTPGNPGTGTNPGTGGATGSPTQGGKGGTPGTIIVNGVTLK